MEKIYYLPDEYDCENRRCTTCCVEYSSDYVYLSSLVSCLGFIFLTTLF